MCIRDRGAEVFAATGVRVHRGRQNDDLVWTGHAFALSDSASATLSRVLLRHRWLRLKNRLAGAFLPDGGTVTEDYWDWTKYRCFHVRGWGGERRGGRRAGTQAALRAPCRSFQSGDCLA